MSGSTSWSASSSGPPNDERLQSTLRAVLGLELATVAPSTPKRSRRAVMSFPNHPISTSKSMTPADANAAVGCATISSLRFGATSGATSHLLPAIESELLEAASLAPDAAARTSTARAPPVPDQRGTRERYCSSCPFLVRRLATTTANEEEWSAERIRGAIRWGRTIGVRQATGIPHLYVTAPARRAFQTAENELLVTVLDAVVLLGRQSGWHRSESADVGKLISSRVAEAERWLPDARARRNPARAR